MRNRQSLIYFLLICFLVVLTGCKKEEPGELKPVVNKPDNTYSISALEASGYSFNTSSVTDNARGIQLVGDTLLLVHSRGTNSVVTYILENRGDIASAKYYSSYSAADYIGSTSQGTNGHGLFIRQDDLKKMWLFNRTEIWEFNLAEAGNVSTAEYSDYLDLSDYVERGHGIFFKPDGSQLFIDDRNKALIHQFELTQNWNISEYSSYKTLDISDYQQAVRAVTFHPDGEIMYLLDTQLKEIQHFDLSTPWQIEGAVFKENKSIAISNPRSFTWNSNGTKAYIMNTDNGVILEYTID